MKELSSKKARRSKIVRMELDEKSPPGKTDWKRVKAMRDEDIAPDEDTPDASNDAEFWANAKPFVVPKPREQVSVRLNPDVLQWFRAQGKGWQSHVNAILEAFVEHHKSQHLPYKKTKRAPRASAKVSKL